MATLADAMGARLVYLRRAWKVRAVGRYGYITLEREAGDDFFVFYLLVSGSWNKLAFKRVEGVADIYLAASNGVVVNVGIKEGDPSPRLQLLVEVEGNSRWWLIYLRPDGDRLLLVTVRTSVDPYTVVV